MNPNVARPLEKVNEPRSAPKAIPGPAEHPALPAPGQGTVRQTSSGGAGGSGGAMVWIIVLMVLAVGGYFGWRYWQGRSATAEGQGSGGRGGRAQGPPPVVAATVTKGDIHIYLDGLGQVTPFKTVTVRTQVDGQIVSINFEEGQTVKIGDLLAQIDPRPYAAAVEQAQGKLLSDQAFLENAKIDLKRDEDANKTGAISDQQLATQQALVDQYEANIIGDQGQVDAAKVNLAYCKITSPIDGRIGLRLVDLGNIVHATDATGLAVITQLHPIAVVFALPEDDLPAVMKTRNSGSGLPVLAYDRDEQTLIAHGKVEAIDNQVDPTTGTFKVKASFANLDNALFPQQFVNAHLLVDTKMNQTLVPAAAVQQGPGTGAFVFVVKPDQTVTIRDVKEGATEGDLEGVSGVEPGEIVVTDGTDKLQEGTKVTVSLAKGAQGASTQPSGRSGRRRGVAGAANQATQPATQAIEQD